MKTLVCVGTSDAAKFLALRPNFDVCYVVDGEGPKSEYLQSLFRFDQGVHFLCDEPSTLDIGRLCVEKGIEEIDTLIVCLARGDDGVLASVEELLREKRARVVECVASSESSFWCSGQDGARGIIVKDLEQAGDDGYEVTDTAAMTNGNGGRVYVRCFRKGNGLLPTAARIESVKSSGKKEYLFNLVYAHLPDADWHRARRGNVSVLVSSVPREGCDLYFYLDAFGYRGGQKGYDILFVCEPHVVLPGSYNEDIWNHFDHVFTMYDTLVQQDERFTKIPSCRSGWAGSADSITEDIAERERLYPVKGREDSICMINGNKCSWVPGELYSKRIEAALWFCTHSDIFFDVYGRPPYLLPNYKGAIENGCRLSVLAKYKYNWCFENTDHPDFALGYTDKILDCLETRTVPIYLGNPNIEKYVPRECFIDFRDFGSYAAVNDYLHSITEDDYMAYVRHIDRWVSSGGLRPYSWYTAYDYLIRWYSKRTGTDFQSLVGKDTGWERELTVPKAPVALPTPWTFDDLRFRPSQFMSPKEILEAKTTHPLRKIVEESEARVRRAVDLATSGAYIEAVKEIALCGYTGAANPHYLSAQMMHLAGLQDPVLVQLYTAIAIDPDHSYAYNQLGTVYYERKEHRQAEAAFRKAVELDNGNHLARKNLAFLLFQTGRKEEAVPMFRAVEPYFPEEIRALSL